MLIFCQFAFQISFSSSLLNRALFEDEKPDDDFLRESEEIIARKSGLPENSIFRYDLDKQGVLSDVYSTYYRGGGECER